MEIRIQSDVSLFINGKPVISPIVKKLCLSNDFNHPLIIDEGDIRVALPNGLKTLKIDCRFNHPLINSHGEKALPDNLKKLIFTDKSNEELRLCANDGRTLLPNGLKTLTLSRKFYDPLGNLFPENLTKLDFSRSFMNFELFYNNGSMRILPNSLKTLIFSMGFNNPLISNTGLKALPDNLEKLVFGYKFDLPLYDSEDGKIILALPTNLKYLRLGYCFNQCLITNGIKLLPDSIHYLQCKIGSEILKMSQYHKNILPANLTNFIVDEDHHAFLYRYMIFSDTILSVRLNRDYNNHDIAMYIQILKFIDNSLPLPIAEEIIDHYIKDINDDYFYDGFDDPVTF